MIAWSNIENSENDMPMRVNDWFDWFVFTHQMCSTEEQLNRQRFINKYESQGDKIQT